MGFKQVKEQLLVCLEQENVVFEERADKNVKNLLAAGTVSVADVASVVRRATGNDYQSSPHHQIGGVDVHVISKREDDVKWYLKWYYVEPNCVIISVHH